VAIEVSLTLSGYPTFMIGVLIKSMPYSLTREGDQNADAKMPNLSSIESGTPHQGGARTAMRLNDGRYEADPQGSMSVLPTRFAKLRRPTV
jgi:hypothetical protein